MYLAISDKVIQLKQDLVYTRCKHLIREWQELPWFIRIFCHNDLLRMIEKEWREFEIWQNQRIETMRRTSEDTYITNSSVSFKVSDLQTEDNIGS